MTASTTWTSWQSAGAPHLTWEYVSAYLDRGDPVLLPLPGTPRIEYFVEPSRPEIGLRMAVAPGTSAPISLLASVSARIVSAGGQRLLEVSCQDGSLLRDFHELLGSIAARVRTDGLTPVQAFVSTVSSWSDLLQRLGRMGINRQLGLLGEIETLKRLGPALGWSVALDAWKGGEGEEHDFGLPNLDLEVKTTSQEARRHTIHGWGQLTPSPGRPLWLLSHQYTRGGADGRTLGQEIEALRQAVADDPSATLTLLERKLAGSGWTPVVEQQPPIERWLPRSSPLLLVVDEQVPRLDNDLLASLPEATRSRLREVDYVVDLSDLPPTIPVPDCLLPLFDHPVQSPPHPGRP